MGETLRLSSVWIKPLVIGRDAVFQLNTDEFHQLRTENSIVWKYPTVVRGRTRISPSNTDICLAIDKSRSDYFFEFEPEMDLNLLLDWSYLVNYDIETFRIHKFNCNSLREDLMSRNMNNIDAVPRVFLPVQGEQDEYKNTFTDSTIKALETDGRVFGQLAVCSCENPGCGATYAWIEGTIGLLLVEISSAGIFKVEVGPFLVVAP